MEGNTDGKTVKETTRGLLNLRQHALFLVARKSHLSGSLMDFVVVFFQGTFHVNLCKDTRKQKTC